MKIRCKLIRPKGTTVSLGKGKESREYHFKPVNPDKPHEDHVSEVNNKDDIAALLAIPEAYEVHDSHISAGKSKSAKKSDENQDGGAGKENTGDGGQGSGYADLEKAELVKLVTERTGKKPHHSTAKTKLVAQLEALDAQ